MITPAEFENNLSTGNDAQVEKKSNRPEDSWMPNQAVNANGAATSSGIPDAVGDKQDSNLVDHTMTSATAATDQNAEMKAANAAVKKRTHEEAFPTGAVCEPTIDEVLTSLKQRVLIGESLNNFKKEVNQLVELIDKKDP